jgi:hypothetical protein
MFQSASAGLAGVLGQGPQNGGALDEGQIGHAGLGLVRVVAAVCTNCVQANTRCHATSQIRGFWRKGFPRVEKRQWPFQPDAETAIMVLS